MPGKYDPLLLSIAFMIAVIGSYIAIDLAQSIAARRSRARVIGLIGGSISLGGALWGVHFLSTMGLRFASHAPRFSLSVLAAAFTLAVLTIFLLFFVSMFSSLSWLWLIAGGIVASSGILGVHFFVVASMRHLEVVLWSRYLIMLAFLVAFGAAAVSFEIAKRYKKKKQRSPTLYEKASYAMVIGGLLLLVHVLAMGGTSFTFTQEGAPSSLGSLSASSSLAFFTTLALVLVLTLAFTGSVLERAFARLEIYAKDNARLLAESETTRGEITRRLIEEESLARLGRLSLSGTTVESIASVALKETRLTLAASCATLFKLMPAGDQFSPLLWSGYNLAPGTSPRLPAGPSTLPGVALLRSEPVFYNRSTSPPEFNFFDLCAKDAEIMSEVGCVIGDKKSPWGVLVAHAIEEKDYSNHDMSFLQALGNILYLSIQRELGDEERQRLLRNEQLARTQAEEHAKEEAALRHAAESVTRHFTVEEISKATTEASLDSLHASAVLLILLQENGTTGVLAGSAGALPNNFPQKFPAEGSLTKYLLEKHGGALLLPSGKSGSKFTELQEVSADASLLSLPLKSEGVEFGALLIFRPKKMLDFTQAEISRATTFADLATLAFKKLHLIESAIHREKELRRVMESRERLIRGFSHDIRNPLSAADGFAQLLQDEIHGPLTEKQRTDLDRIRNSLSNSLDLTESLVELVQAESGTLPLKLSNVSISSILSQLVDTFQAKAEIKALDLSLRLPENQVYAQTDLIRFRQIMENILSNALKYTREGSVQVLLFEAHNQIKISVSDTGPGIPEKEHGKIFQEFSRIEGVLDKGHGLGLAISQRLAHLLGGAIAVESTEGEGSTFTLSLPLNATVVPPSDYAPL